MLGKLVLIMKANGDHNRSKAYEKAKASMANHREQITDPEFLSTLPNIGKKIVEKAKEYLETGTLKLIEKNKNNPKIIFCNIYGVGPKKAKELVDTLKLKSIEELRQYLADPKNKDTSILNDKQIIGLKHYEALCERIPRKEIDVFDQWIKSTLDILKMKSVSYQIMGSWRREKPDSGDVDILFTDTKKKSNNFQKIIQTLKAGGVIIETLSEGPKKSLTICEINPNRKPRRVDFMYCEPKNFAFSALYFTGSAEFNVAMRKDVQEKGFTLNEHGLYEFHNRVKGRKLKIPNITSRIAEEDPERPIFDFLNYEYRAPSERRSAADLIRKKTSMPLPTLAAQNQEIKTRLIKLSTDGTDTLAELPLETLSTMYDLASKAYYNQKPIISDGVFDILKEHIEGRFPDAAVLLCVGADLPSATERITELPVLMPSMNKIKSDTNALENWCGKYSGQVVYSSKLDGVSGLLHIVGGEEPKLYSRGNGKEGQDISHLLSVFKNEGEKISTALSSLLESDKIGNEKSLIVRGEFIMKKAAFEKYAYVASNARNLVSGLINRKEYDAKSKEQLVDMDFVAYEIVKPVMKPSEQMALLEEMGLRTVFNGIWEEGANTEVLSKTLKDRRENDEYEIDGIIVTHDEVYERNTNKVENPKHGFAYKMILSDQIVEAKVVDVLWEPSPQGYVKPRVRIEPVNVNGVTIEYATAHNAGFIRDNKIGVGAVLEIIRSGDVIPKINGVITPAEHTKMYKGNFVWTESNVDIVLSDIKGNRVVQEKAIVQFFRRISVAGLARGNVSRMMDAGFDTLAKILSMSEEDYLKVDGFKEKKAKKIYAAIKSSLEECGIIEFISATGVFGRGLGSSRIRAIMEKYPLIFSEKKTTEENAKRVASLPGFANKTAKSFVDHLDEFRTFVKVSNLTEYLDAKFAALSKSSLEEVGEVGEAKEMEEVSNDGENIIIRVKKPLAGKSIVFSGFRNKTLKCKIENMGGQVKDRIEKSTNLVLRKGEKISSKIKAAKKRGIEIMDVKQFIKTHEITDK